MDISTYVRVIRVSTVNTTRHFSPFLPAWPVDIDRSALSFRAGIIARPHFSTLRASLPLKHLPAFVRAIVLDSACHNLRGHRRGYHDVSQGVGRAPFANYETYLLCIRAVLLICHDTGRLWQSTAG